LLQNCNTNTTGCVVLVYCSPYQVSCKSDNVSVALNTGFGPADPSQHFPIAEANKATQQPVFGSVWAFSVAINLPVAASSADSRALSKASLVDCGDAAL
jgi:hypothetical protein